MSQINHNQNCNFHCRISFKWTQQIPHFEFTYFTLIDEYWLGMNGKADHLTISMLFISMLHKLDNCTELRRAFITSTEYNKEWEAANQKSVGGSKPIVMYINFICIAMPLALRQHYNKLMLTYDPKAVSFSVSSQMWFCIFILCKHLAILYSGPPKPEFFLNQ